MILCEPNVEIRSDGRRVNRRETMKELQSCGPVIDTARVSLVGGRRTVASILFRQVLDWSTPTTRSLSTFPAFHPGIVTKVIKDQDSILDSQNA